MKHLRKFNENICDDISFQKDLKDICLELQDKGFYIDLRIESTGGFTRFNSFNSSKFDPNSSCIKLTITHYKRTYKFEEIEDVVERIKEYSIQNEYRCQFIWRIESDEHGIKVGTFHIFKNNYVPSDYWRLGSIYLKRMGPHDFFVSPQEDIKNQN